MWAKVVTEEFRLPGEKIAFSEEYISGENTFDDGESVRSSVIGQVDFDKEERIASIRNNKSIPVPNIGDTIVGVVEAALGSMIAVSMQYINNTKIKQKGKGSYSKKMSWEEDLKQKRRGIIL